MDRIILVQEEPRVASELVEVPVTVADNGKFRIAFPDNQQLRSLVTQAVVIKTIRLITPDVLTNAPINGAVTSPVAEMQKATLVIYCEGWEKGHYIPLLTLNDTTTPAGTAAHTYHAARFADWKNVDWPKCYIQYSNGTTGAVSNVTPYCFLFDVQYVKLDAFNKIINGPS